MGRGVTESPPSLRGGRGEGDVRGEGGESGSWSVVSIKMKTLLVDVNFGSEWEGVKWKRVVGTPSPAPS